MVSCSKACLPLHECSHSLIFLFFILKSRHLGTCDEGYLPTERGFDSYVGYLAGGSSYYNHAADFRNGTNSSALGAPTACVGSTSSVNGRYSAELFASEAARIAVNHNASKPLFLYLAMQNVHNPYDVPPIDVNHTYPEILEYERRVYAGMVAELDTAVANVTAAFEQAGLWQDTLFIFTTGACMRLCCAVLARGVSVVSLTRMPLFVFCIFCF